ncbi:bifunctional nitrate reductase/sulfite reductase flavoprotein subunit alpha [Nocardia sp. alder85J]|uniref:bifunctional nitrate reductase/sulfite reductase flavoprotein subunit alpha n=1 Tax=Nocardia sp. alder85J TaxID=2862949 RepID=UPI001CD58679|nr:bifunctional nitrate reductase/sulfite reductase flavoprotein subunit alpha [Nocardia sp. alder85J]MCX4097670.1 bifunctional nitrate reductase/sulfite reductase flavoprotein subunit alpha [Nocardia sp. alder85J]
MAQSTEPTSSTRTVCSYCGVGCGIIVETRPGADGAPVIAKVRGDKLHPVNGGRLCTKGATHAELMRAPGRMAAAYRRAARGRAPAPMPVDDAIEETAARLRAILDEHGPDAIALYVSGQLSIEAQYLATKLAKGYLRTVHLEANSRLCMASAGTGYKQSLGADGPPGSYDDIDRADLFFVIGANMADCHPILFLRMVDRLHTGARLIVVDPRRTDTAARADLFLQIAPGTDLALLNGLLHLLVDNGDIDAAFIAEHTRGWDAMPAFLAGYPPAEVAAITGLAEDDIRTAARWIGEAGEWMSLWTMGLNQSTHGTWNTNALCNLHLATGALCRPGSGPFSLTGQPNAMGGREMGYMGPGLPGQRTVFAAADRSFVETAWGLAPGSIRDEAGPGTVEMFHRLAAGEIKACWVMCSNPVASMANRRTVIAGLEAAELVIVQDVYTETATTAYADLLLPATLWSESDAVMVNSERTLTLLARSTDPAGEARPDWQLIAQVATAMGFAGFDFASSAEVFEEIRGFTNPATGYDLRGIDYAGLREGPMQWPCPDPAQRRNPIRYRNDGTVREPFTDETGHRPRLVFPAPGGRAVFHPRPHMLPAEMPDDDYPFVLNTGRLQHQWHTMTKTGRVAKLTKLTGEPFAEIHPDDGERLGMRAGDALEITSRRGRAVLPVRITDRVLPGSCFAPFHWNDEHGEYLTVNAVTSDAVDADSLQPEFKVCAVALRKVAVAPGVDRMVAAGGRAPVVASGQAPAVAGGRAFPEVGGRPLVTAAGQSSPIAGGQAWAAARDEAFPTGGGPAATAAPGQWAAADRGGAWPGAGGPPMTAVDGSWTPAGGGGSASLAGGGSWADRSGRPALHPLSAALGLETAIAPTFSEAERIYLAGYLAALHEIPVRGQPMLPESSPLSPQSRTWVNGLLAGMYSRAVEPVLGTLIPAVAADPVAAADPERSITVLWASQTGTAEELAATAAAMLAESGFRPRLLELNSCAPDELSGDTLVITSTFGTGGPPDNGSDFWDSLSDSAIRLTGVRFAVFALGDSSYDDFCGYGRKIDELLAKLGATRVLPRVDSEPDHEELSEHWLTEVLAAFGTAAPQSGAGPAGGPADGPDAGPGGGPVTASAGGPAAAPVPAGAAPGTAPRAAGVATLGRTEKPATAAPFTRQSPVPAPVVRNRLLSRPGAAKEVRQFGFDLSGLGVRYEAGDALGVWPTNDEALVAEWLEVTGLDGDRSVEPDGRAVPLAEALRTRYDITRPGPDLLAFVATENPSPRLAKLLRRDNRNELDSYLWDKQAVDVLRDFPVRADAVDWLGVLKKLQPRQYSISSSPLVTPDEVQLTVSVVRYAQRGGVCSTFLADRCTTAPVPVFLQRAPHFRPPLDPNAPMIMVGPGTGIAPFRGFLQERRVLGCRGRNWLFFGDQHAADNFYYRAELEDMFRSGFLTRLDLAFSRDQRERVYVQHRMIEHGAELWSWLSEGGHLYVCGDAARMAKDVDDALLTIAQVHGKLDEAGAAAFKKRLVAEKRYLRDVY